MRESVGGGGGLKERDWERDRKGKRGWGGAERERGRGFVPSFEWNTSSPTPW